MITFILFVFVVMVLVFGLDLILEAIGWLIVGFCVAFVFDKMGK
jgi:hypothetical protein